MELINHKNVETYAITQRTSSKVRRPSTLMNSDFLILVFYDIFGWRFFIDVFDGVFIVY
jgi:hypothetical protein